MNEIKRQMAREPGRTRITSRDLTLLSFIALAQPVTTSHLVMRSCSSLQVTRRRLRVLRDHHLVKVVVQSMDSENLYLLSDRGAEFLVERGLVADGAARMLRAVPKSLAHHLPSASFAAALSTACERSGKLTLIEYLMERDIRKTLGAPKQNLLIPDATAVIAGSSGATFALAVEVDTGSERNPSWVAEHKGRGYAELRAAGSPLRGQVTWAVVLLVPTQRRLNRLAQAFFGAELPLNLFYFALMDSVAPNSILTDQPWQALRLIRADNRVRLVNVSPLSALATSTQTEPRSNASRARVSARNQTESSDQSRHHGDHGS